MIEMPDQKLEGFFIEAMALSTEEREQFLQSVCQKDKELGLQLQWLVDNYLSFDDHMEKPVPHVDLCTDTPTLVATAIGSEPLPPYQGQRVIGPYKTARLIACGGMGQVYKASHTGSKQEVALKLIHGNTSSVEFCERFQKEYKILALMNHSNIAQLYNSGVSPQGEAYYAMEYVHGQTITQYCLGQEYSLNDSLTLMLQVCDGVAHAHQRSVVHRDLKPSNILVTEKEGEPLVKIIDFGIGKILDTQMTENFQTRKGSILGTPAYMSPEQLTGDPAQVDTRTDVYSLGVLLYQILTGRLPYKRDRALKQHQWHEYMVQVRDKIPHLPSARLQAGAELVSDEQRARQMKRKARLIRKELDWIVMRALEKDKERRYRSVLELRDDLDAYLNGRPVSAKPPGLFYMWSKFVVGHKVLFLTLSFVLLSLSAGLGLAVRESRLAHAAEIQARQAQMETQRVNNQLRVAQDFLHKILSAADPKQMGHDTRVVDLLDQARSELDNVTSQHMRTESLITLGNTYFTVGRYNDAVALLEEAHDLLVHSDNDLALARTRFSLGKALLRKDPKRASSFLQQATTWYQEHLGERHPQTLDALATFAMAQRKIKNLDLAESSFHRALTLQKEVLGLKHPQTLRSIMGLANVFMSQGRIDEAYARYQTVLDLQSEYLGSKHPETLATKHNIANILLNKDIKTGRKLALETLKHREEVLGKNHPLTLGSLTLTGRYALKSGQKDQAIGIFYNALSMRLDSPHVVQDQIIRSCNFLAKALNGSSESDLSILILEDTLALIRKEGTQGNSNESKILHNLGHMLRTQGQHEMAFRYLSEALSYRENLNNKTHIIITRFTLAETLEDLGRFDEAGDYYCSAWELAKESQDRFLNIIERHYRKFLKRKREGNFSKVSQ